VSANARPWADVAIDGKSGGQTPISNLQVPIGVHEVVFRHPRLGERRQTVVVKAGPPPAPLARFATRIESGQVMVEL